MAEKKKAIGKIYLLYICTTYIIYLYYYLLHNLLIINRYMICCQKFCNGSARRLADGTIVNNVAHSHQPNNLENELLELKKKFRLILVQRAVNETTKLSDIYDEESIRY